MHVFVGYDPREDCAYQVCKSSILRHSPESVVHPIHLDRCQRLGLYTRPFEYVDGKPYDSISNAPMSTEFALSRFLVPWLAKNHSIEDQFVLFCDCDMLFRCDVNEVLEHVDANSHKAVWCVKHDVEHGEGIKMDGCAQTQYFRKNWSSVMLWNLHHEGNERLTLEDVNTRRGLWLHSFLWLEDNEIGGLPKEFNHLVGVSPPNPEAKIVHHTLGGPFMPGYEQSEFADEWFAEFNRIEGE